MYAYAIGIACIAAFAVAPVHRAISYAYEDYEFSQNPSAQFAFELGNKHFNAAASAPHYDIDRARYFYFKTAHLDVNHPMIFQQIARTSFVQGDFTAALAQINFQLSKHADSNASAYYIRALVYAFLGNFKDSAADYQHYIELDPHTWAAYNDLAWTQMKLRTPQDALKTIDRALLIAPENAWLLTTRTTALVELGRLEEAREVAIRAVAAAKYITPEEWALQYKGNDPQSIPQGIAELVSASTENLHKIEQMLAASSTVSLH